jgi:hypothetical protein
MSSKWSLAFRDLTKTYSFPVVPAGAKFVGHLITNNNVKPITCFLSYSAIFYLLTVGVEDYYWRLFILRHTTLGRIPLDDGSARRRNLYLTTHNTHKRQIFMSPVGFEPEIPASECPQTYAIDRAVTGTGWTCNCRNSNGIEAWIFPEELDEVENR